MEGLRGEREGSENRAKMDSGRNENQLSLPVRKSTALPESILVDFSSVTVPSFSRYKGELDRLETADLAD